MTEQTPPESTDTTSSAPTVVDDDLTGHMVYDLTLRRFVGRKADTVKAAESTVTKVKGHRYETRAV